MARPEELHTYRDPMRKSTCDEMTKPELQRFVYNQVDKIADDEEFAEFVRWCKSMRCVGQLSDYLRDNEYDWWYGLLAYM